MQFEVIFYEDENGNNPVESFLNSLTPKLRAKSSRMIELLEDKGNELRKPFSRHIEDGIFELRCI